MIYSIGVTFEAYMSSIEALLYHYKYIKGYICPSRKGAKYT